MIQRWLSTISSLITTFFQMVPLVWQAQPICFVGLSIVLLVQGLLPLATAWLTKVLFDLLSEGIFHRQVTPTLVHYLFFLLVAQVGLILVTQFLSPLNQYLNAELGRELALKIKTSIYQKINSFIGLSYFEDPHFHDTIQLATRGAQFSPLQTLTVVTSLLQGTVTVVTFLSVLVAFNPLLATIVGVAVLPQLYIQLKFSRRRFGIAFDNNPKERRASYYGQVLSLITFAKEVRLFNIGDYFLRSFVQTTRAVQQAQRAQQRLELCWQVPLSLLAGAITSGAFVVVILQAFSGHLSLGDVALYTSAVMSVQSTLLSIVGALSQMNENAMFYRQYTALLTFPQSLWICTSAQHVPPLTCGITLRNVSFRYSDQHPWVLRHIDVFLPAGKCLALVGLNGAGKTTLVKLLTRLYDPTEGQILWDGIDIREFDPQELRQHMSTIFQDFSHYDLTVQHNIGLGNVVQIENSAVVQQAAVKAGIHERIAALPQGYQSFLGRWLANERPGVELSGGEWQKIALARMFMREADLLIMDEPTASLDAQAEYDLYTYFRQLMRGCTSLLITHRFSTVRMADIIAVIEQGQITQYGTHEELMSVSRTYANLYTLQAEHYIINR